LPAVPLTGPPTVPPSPATDGWQTETVSESAEGRLKKLMQLMTNGQALDAKALANLVDHEFRGTVLLPKNLETVFQDAGLTVKRPAAWPDEMDEEDFSVYGLSGLAGALNQLLTRNSRGSPEPMAEAIQRRGKFKIFRIQLQADIAETDVLFQFSEAHASGIVQHAATWRCSWNLKKFNAEPRLMSIRLLDYEQSVGSGRLFADCTEAVLGGNSSYSEQLAFGHDHWLKRLELVNGIVPTSYQGLAIADVDGDGLDDLYVCQPGGLLGGLPNRLYLQNPDGTARDASATSKLDWLLETPSALFVDLDDDGDQDLVGATMAGLIIAENDGRARFQLRAAKLIPEAPPISLAAADFDGDGDLDIYACCYAARASSELVGRPVPYHDANNGGRNALFRNDTNWRFTNVTKQVGLDQNNRRFSFAAAWEDFDNDGDQDLYVANDFGRNNLYRNSAGQFQDVAQELGVEDISAGMSVSWGDYNNDGWMDLYVSNMWSSAGGRVAYQREFLDARADAGTREEFQRHARGNSLFLNQGGTGRLGFRDVSQSAGVSMGRWAWSSRLVDLNNDSLLDIVVANGNITQDDTGDL
jgi:hypothetical protein